MSARLTPEEYKAQIAKADAAVATIPDPTLKDVARHAILNHLVSGNVTHRYLKDPANIALLSIGFLLGGAGALTLWCGLGWGTTILITCAIDLFMLFLICIVAIHADGRANWSKWLPNRFPALLLGALLFVGLVHCFANLYRMSNSVCASGTACVVETPQKPAMSTKVDDLYFSAVTMMTLGYGDLYAGAEPARGLVIWQLCNSVLMLILVLPLIASRIAVF